MANSKQIVYLSQAQYADLIANGSITVDGVTVTYDENDIYVTPQAEPVTDVRVAGTSVAANGVADIPKATASTLGVVMPSDGLQMSSAQNGKIMLAPASSTQIKGGIKVNVTNDISKQHEATFYGLAKAAGYDEASSTEPLGTYTPEAKAAIQSMLGVSDLIAPAENNLVASKAYKVGDVFTANGKLYKATAAIAADAAIIPAVEGEEIAGVNCEETSVGEGFPHDVQVNGVSVVSDGVANIPKANTSTLGVVKVHNAYGIGVFNDSTLKLNLVSENEIKNMSGGEKAITQYTTDKATFFGLARAAGDTTQSQSSNAVGTYTDEAKSAIRGMLGAVGNEDYATNDTAGVIKTSPADGSSVDANGVLKIGKSSTASIKAGSGTSVFLMPSQTNLISFYGLAKAAGDTTMASSTNAVGTYTDNAKASIKAMLGIQDGSTGTVDVSGTTPTITAVENTRYVCGEVTSLSFTPPASGISIIRFTSGSTVTVLTIPSTVKFPEWFDPTSLETNTIYEICVTDGIYGAVMSWAL